MFANSRRLITVLAALGACAFAGAGCSSSNAPGVGSGGAGGGSGVTAGRGGAPTGGGGAPAGTGGATPTGSGGATAGAGGTERDSGCETDAGILFPAPVLDPTGTYAGKTYGEWGAAWTKWLNEFPGPDFPVRDSTGALCASGQSGGDDGGAGANDIFFLANNWAIAGGNVTRSCTIPAGQMIFIPIALCWADNGGVPAGSQETDQQLQGDISACNGAINALDFELDGKSYGSTVCDFASYLTAWTQFSYTVPDTPTNICNTLPACWNPNWSGSVPKSFAGGYYIMLAPLSAGSHTLHFSTTRGLMGLLITVTLPASRTTSPWGEAAARNLRRLS